MNILVIRFRQIGDAILTTVLLNSLHQTFPDAKIDFVLNENIASLFEHHPAISRIITFSEDDRHNFFTYLRKVWRIVRQTRYDIIIDKRSTINTMPFALFSLRTPWRIGQKKPYTRFIYNHHVESCRQDESMIHHMLATLRPLEAIAPIHEVRDMSLGILPEEIAHYRHYMQQQGIDFSRPVAVVSVSSKLPEKTWPIDRMTELLRRVIDRFPTLQLIFNYIPGPKETEAHRIYNALLSTTEKGNDVLHEGLPLNVLAHSPRELAMLCASTTLYFGNEGGGRHIAHAMHCPSFSICSPSATKENWIPQNTAVEADAIAPSDFASPAQLAQMSPTEQYNLLTVDRVWQRLEPFIDNILKTQNS